MHRDEQTAAGKLVRTVIGQTTVEWIPLVHSFPVTERYVVIPQYPIQIDIMAAAENRDVMDGIRWVGDKEPVYFHVFDARSSDPKASPVKVFKAEAFFALHQINAYEVTTGNGTVIHFDCIGYEDGFLMTNKKSFGNIQYMKDPSCCGGITGSMKLRHYALDMRPEPAPSPLAVPVSGTARGSSPNTGVPPAVSTLVTWNMTGLWDDESSDEILVEIPRINDGLVFLIVCQCPTIFYFLLCAGAPFTRVCCRGTSNKTVHVVDLFVAGPL